MEIVITEQNRTIENAIELVVIQRIHEIRGKRVMLDFDLAEIYQVETKNLKRSVKHNIERFPDDFMFELTQDEIDALRCKKCTLKTGSRGEHSKYLPFAFTEQGVAMLSGVLRSQRAIQENIKIMRAFVAIRQYVLNYSEIKHELVVNIISLNSQFSILNSQFSILNSQFSIPL